MRNAAVAVGLLFVLGGCAGQDVGLGAREENSRLPPGAMSWADFVDEYHAAANRLRLPAGQRWRASLVPPSPDTVVEEGAGETEAVFEWNCAWGAEYLKHHSSDPARAEDALEEYSSLRETEAWHTSWPPESQAVVNATITAAERGDVSGIEEIVTANCPERR